MRPLNSGPKPPGHGLTGPRPPLYMWWTFPPTQISSASCRTCIRPARPKAVPCAATYEDGALLLDRSHFAKPALRLPVTGSSKPAAVKARTSKSTFAMSSEHGATMPTLNPEMARKSGCTLRTSSLLLSSKAIQPGPLSTQLVATTISGESFSPSIICFSISLSMGPALRRFGARKERVSPFSLDPDQTHIALLNDFGPPLLSTQT